MATAKIRPLCCARCLKASVFIHLGPGRYAARLCRSGIPSIDGNHAIAAIEIPSGYTNPLLESVISAKNGTRYLIFDPTNEWIPLGQIPPYEQSSYGILSRRRTEPAHCFTRVASRPDRIEHTIHAQLAADGSLEATSSSSASAMPPSARASPSPRAASNSSVILWKGACVPT